MKAQLALVIALTLALGFFGGCSSEPSFKVAASKSISPVEPIKAQIVGTWESSDYPYNGFTYYGNGTGVRFWKDRMRQDITALREDITWTVTSKYDRPFLGMTSSRTGMEGGLFVEVDGDIIKYWEPGTNFSANPKAKPDHILHRSK